MEEKGDQDRALSIYEQALTIQQLLGDKAGIATTQDNINAIYRQRNMVQTTLRLLISEAEQFFQSAGFTLGATGAPDSFLCLPASPRWKRKFNQIYTQIVIGQSFDQNMVLRIRNAVQNLPGEMKVAFIVVDQTVDEPTWMLLSALRANRFNLIPIPFSFILEYRSTEKPIQLEIGLSRHLELFLGPGADPYNITHPVFDVLNFFGREVLAHSLADTLISGQPIGLFGLRRIGKSSLMLFMKGLMPYPTARLVLQAGVEPTGLYTRILRAWQSDAQMRFKLDLGLQNVTISSAEPGVEFFKIAQSTLDYLARYNSDAKLAFFLDEIELIMPPLDATGPLLEQYLSLMHLLRGLVQEDGRFPLVVAGVDPLVNRTSRWGNEEKQNPFFMLLQEFYVPPLLKSDCIHMSRNIGSQVGLSYSDEASNTIAQASGGHPFLTRQLCSLAYNMHGSGKIEQGTIQKAIERFLFDDKYAATLNDKGLWGEITKTKLWGDRTAQAHQKLLFTLARSREPVAESALVAGLNNAALRSALFSLQELNVIRNVEESAHTEDAHYVITFGLLHSWIRRIRLGLEG